jgi:hypothetical protein
MERRQNSKNQRTHQLSQIHTKNRGAVNQKDYAAQLKRKVVKLRDIGTLMRTGNYDMGLHRAGIIIQEWNGLTGNFSPVEVYGQSVGMFSSGTMNAIVTGADRSNVAVSLRHAMGISEAGETMRLAKDVGWTEFDFQSIRSYLQNNVRSITTSLTDPGRMVLIFDVTDVQNLHENVGICEGHLDRLEACPERATLILTITDNQFELLFVANDNHACSWKTTIGMRQFRKMFPDNPQDRQPRQRTSAFANDRDEDDVLETDEGKIRLSGRRYTMH